MGWAHDHGPCRLGSVHRDGPERGGVAASQTRSDLREPAAVGRSGVVGYRTRGGLVAAEARGALRAVAGLVCRAAVGPCRSDAGLIALRRTLPPCRFTSTAAPTAISSSIVSSRTTPP